VHYPIVSYRENQNDSAIRLRLMTNPMRVRQELA
jgi:hypothetical protein